MHDHVRDVLDVALHGAGGADAVQGVKQALPRQHVSLMPCDEDVARYPLPLGLSSANAALIRGPA